MSKYDVALRELNYMLADKDNFYSAEEKQNTYNVIKEAIAKAKKYPKSEKRVVELVTMRLEEATRFKNTYYNMLKRIEKLENTIKVKNDVISDFQHKLRIAQDELKACQELRRDDNIKIVELQQENKELLKANEFNIDITNKISAEKHKLELNYKVLVDGVKVLLDYYEYRLCIADGISEFDCIYSPVGKSFYKDTKPNEYEKLKAMLEVVENEE